MELSTEASSELSSAMQVAAEMIGIKSAMQVAAELTNMCNGSHKQSASNSGTKI